MNGGRGMKTTTTLQCIGNTAVELQSS